LPISSGEQGAPAGAGEFTLVPESSSTVVGPFSSLSPVAMTPKDFRRLALRLPEAAEGAHMGHADFRVRGRIFATLGWPDDAWAMVKLTPGEQALFVEVEPAAFEPVPGGWGRRGSTQVRLEAVEPVTVRSALVTAWRRVAPKKLAGRAGGTSRPATRPG
jgi:hypothetical protein